MQVVFFKLKLKLKFHVSSYLHFSKEASKSVPYLYRRVSVIGVSKYLTLHTNVHGTINSMAPKNDPSSVKQDISGPSLHMGYHCILSSHHFNN